MSSPNQSPCNPPPLPDLHSNNNIVVHHHDPPENPIISINPIMAHKINPVPFKKLSGAVKYMECLKNHAAAIGGNATDGCGEFMAGGEEGTLEALKCSACNCHRNFHRKIHIQPPPPPLVSINCKNNAASINYSGGAGSSEMKRRFRTKFSQEQKEKMLGFAERAGWKIQKLDDSEVRRFCQEIGIKRKVLKVWMHNNKYHLANKTDAN